MKKESRFLYYFLRRIYRTILIILYRPKIIGAENIPQTGSAILAGNHRHAFDPVLVMMTTKRMVHFLAKKEAFKGLHGKMFEKIGLIKVDRAKATPLAVMKSEGVLKQGGVIGIFPEGTRNKTQDQLLKFKKGAVVMAQRTNTPIIPFSIQGTYRPFHKSVIIQFGEPIIVTDEDRVEANERLRGKVLELLGE